MLADILPAMVLRSLVCWVVGFAKGISEVKSGEFADIATRAHDSELEKR